MAERYFVLIDNQRLGPYQRKELYNVALTPDTPVAKPDMDDWLPARDFPELAAILEAVAKPVSKAILLAPLPEANLRTPYRIGVRTQWAAILVLVVGFALSSCAFSGNEGRPDRLALALSALGVVVLAMILLLIGGIAFLVQLYQSWAVIQDGVTPHSPGKAVGLLFVPFYNFYWIFAATYSLARELNRFADRHALQAPRASLLLGLAVPIYTVLAALPLGQIPEIGRYTGLLSVAAGSLNLILLPLFMGSVFRTARCFCQEHRQPADPAKSTPRPMVSKRSMVLGLFAFLLAPIGIVISLVGASLVFDANPERMKLAKDAVSARLELDRARTERARFEAEDLDRVLAEIVKKEIGPQPTKVEIEQTTQRMREKIQQHRNEARRIFERQEAEAAARVEPAEALLRQEEIRLYLLGGAIPLGFLGLVISAICAGAARWMNVKMNA